MASRAAKDSVMDPDMKRNMNVVNVHDVEYMALYNGSYTLDALTSLTGMPLDRLHYKPKELNRIIKKNL